MNKMNRHKKLKVLLFLEVFIKIEVKDNNIEQAESFKRKLQETVFKVIKLKNTYEKPSKKKKKNSSRKHKKS